MKGKKLKAPDEYAFVKRLKRMGITLQQFLDHKAKVDNKCEICGNACPTGRSLAIDHDHETGKFRGLLCFSCNQKLGWFDRYKTEVIAYVSR